MGSRSMVSVIIPIYRAEKYIRRSVASAQAQTYPNLEIVLIDDGSPDQCPRLCDRFAAEDARIRVVHQVNGGVSAARNAGLMAASGEWAFFLDADDQMLPDTIETLMQMHDDYFADICIVNFRNVPDNTSMVFQQEKTSSARVMECNEALCNMLYQTMFDTSAWGKLVPLRIARQHLFPLGQIYEDLATVSHWFPNVGKVAYLSEKKYLYTINSEGIVSQSYSIRNGLDEKKAMDALYQFIVENLPEAICAVTARRFSSYCHILLSVGKDQPNFRLLRHEIYHIMKHDCSRVMFNRRARLKPVLAQGYSCFLVKRVFGFSMR